MPITFLKYNGPKKSRNGSTTVVYASAGGGGGNVTSTTYENGGYNSSSNVDLTNYVNLNGQQSLSGVKNFENGITFGNPIIDASGNYYFGELDGSIGTGGYLRYNEETDKLESTLPISAPNLNEITGYKYSQIDSSLGLSDSSTTNFFNAYTTQKLHQRIYALEGKSTNHIYQYADIDSSTLNLVDANTDDTFNAYTTQQVHRRLYAVEQLTDSLRYFEYDSSLNAIRCTLPFYTNYWLSAGGSNPNIGSGDASNNINVHQWSDITDYFSDDNTECTFNAYTIQRIYQMAQSAGSIQTITYDDVVDALGFTPMDSSVDLHEEITRDQIIGIIGFEPANAGTVIQNLNANDISTILGYIPYNSSNPAGYLNSSNFKTVNGQSLIGTGNIEINIDSTEFDNINTKINDVSTRVSDISTKVSDISTRVAANETGISSLWNTVNQINYSTNQLNSKIDDVSARVATNSATIATYGTKINDISTRLYAMENNPLWSHFHYDSVHNAVYTDTNFYSMGWSSAGGLRDISTAGSGSSSINVHQWNDITDYFSDDNTDCTFNAYTIQRIYQMAQSASAIQNIRYDDVIDALGFTPMDASAIDDLSAADVSAALGYIPANAATVLTNITSNTITNALGFTPYNASNPAGYITANDISAMITGTDHGSIAGKDYVDWAISNVQTYVDTSLNNMANKMDSSLSQFDASITAIIETIGSTNESVSDRLDTLDGSVAILNSDINRVDSSIAAIDNSIGALDSSIVSLQTAISNYDSSLNSITTQISNLSGIDIIELTALGTTEKLSWYNALLVNDRTKLTNKIFKVWDNTVVQYGTATDASGNTIVTLFSNEYNHTLTSNKFREYEFSSTGNIYPAYTFSALSDGAFNKEGIINKLGYTPYDGSTNPLNFLTSSDLPDYTFQTVDFSLTSRADRVNIYLGNMDSQNYIYEYSYPSTASDASVMPYRIVFSTQSIIDDGSTFTKIFTSVYYNPITDRWETFKYNLLPTGLFTTEKGYLSPDSSASLGAYAEISKINTINGQSLYSPTGSVDLVIDASTSVTSFKTINNESIVGTGNVQIDEGIPATFVNNIWVGTTAQLQANTLRDSSTLYITID